MHVGFMVIARGGKVEVQIFGGGRPGRLPLIHYAADSEGHAVLMGRLHYRRELLARLPTFAVNEDEDDAALVLAVYRHLGPSGVERLEGDFAVVVHDRKRQRLIASRDVMGGYPIYWMQQSETIALATGLRPLVDLLPSRALNVGFLGELQMLPNLEIDYCPDTVFEGVNRLVPGWSLAADLTGGTVRRHEFWKWAERMADPGDAPVEELAARYGELLRQAVRERLHGCLAAHFSGGMDSTAVALLACRELAGQQRPLHALSLVYENLANLDGETAYLEEALQRPGLIAHRIPADNLLDYDVFRAMPLHDEPISGLYRGGVEMTLLNAAVQVGADTVFTGLGADEMLAVLPYYLADLLRRSRVWSAWSEAARWARAQNCSVWRILRPYGILPLLPAAVHAGWRAFLHGGYADWKRQNFWTLPPWILPAFARRGQLRSRALHHVHRNFHSAATVTQSETLARACYAAGDWVRYTLAAPHGIVATHPFRDPRVLTYGMGIRAHVRPAPGLQKPILAEAMRDVLPESIRKRRSKTHYNSVYYAGLARNLSYLETMIRTSAVEELGLFDKACLLRCLQQAALGIGSSDGAIGLDNSLSIVKWLELLPQWLRQRPQPLRVLRSTERETMAVPSA